MRSVKLDHETPNFRGDSKKKHIIFEKKTPNQATFTILLGNAPKPLTSDGFSSRQVEAMSSSLGGDRAKRSRFITSAAGHGHGHGPTRGPVGEGMIFFVNPKKTSGDLMKR